MMRATAFLWVLFAVFFLARAEAQRSRTDAIAAICPDEFPADAAERRELFRDVHAHRFSYSGECLSRAVDALLPAFEDGVSPTNAEFELTAFALVRQTLIGAQCGVWWSRGMDASSLWGARDVLHLRQAENRTRIKTAIQSALRDPQTYDVQAPTACVGRPVGRSYQDVTSSMLTPLIFSLDDERSIGVYTSWSNSPLLDYNFGLEEEYSLVSRRVRLRRTFLLRREGAVERLSEGADRSDPGLVNIYQAGPSHIGLIVDGAARLIDTTHWRWRPLEGSNPDTWVYRGAFGFLQWRTSLGNLDGETGFIDNHTQLECIPVIGGEVLYRLSARSERCDHPVYPSLEGPTTFVLTRLLADHLLELEPVLPGIAVVRAISPRGAGVERSREFMFVRGNTHYEISNAPPSAAVLVIKVFGDGRPSSVAESAQRYAFAGVPEFWAVDVPNARIVRHRDPERGAYADVENIGRMTQISPTQVPWLRLSFGDLEMARLGVMPPPAH